MSLTIRDQVVTGRARIVSRGTNKRTHITVHETANTSRGANAAAHARLQAQGNSRSASWHWQVDDHEAVRSYPHTAICWHAGSRRGSRVSIAVEICVNSDGDQDQAYRNAAELVARIRKEEGIPQANVVQHNHWSGKNCPTKLRSGRPMGWAGFLALVAQYADGKPATPAPPKETFLMALTDEQQDELLQLMRKTSQNAENAVIETRSITAALGRLGKVAKESAIWAARGYAYARTGALDGPTAADNQTVRAEAARFDPSNK